MRLKSVTKKLLCSAAILCLIAGSVDATFAQTQTRQRSRRRTDSHPTRPRIEMSAEARGLLDQAMDVVCKEQKLDPIASVTIDEMQARPSLPVHAPEAQAGLARAQRVLPIAKTLVISSLQQLVADYSLKSRMFQTRIRRAIARVKTVRRIKPDMESRDNAAVFLTRPTTITFGTIFLAGLKSDEGMISVLAHELMHIADGNGDSLRALVVAVSRHATALTGLDVRGQRGEELTCDLIGVMAARSFVADSPSYESVARRLARSIQHNCVDIDEGDDDHLSPRSTIRALLAVHPLLVRELVYNRQERIQ
jgi:hypothetical protein